MEDKNQIATRDLMQNIKMSSTDGDLMAEMFKAFSKAQSQIDNILADTDMNGLFKYAELHQVISVLRKPFSENGLSYTQIPSGRKTTDGITVDYLTTMIMHESGQYISGTMVLPVSPADAENSVIQKLGAAITYARRYMLMSMTGIAQVDDESELIPDFELKVEKGGFDIEALRDQGIEAAEKGEQEFKSWYESLNISIKNYLRNNAPDVLEDIRLNIAKPDPLEEMF